MKKSEEFAEDIKSKMEHDAPYIWMHLNEQKEKGFDFAVYPDQDMIRKEDFSFFITKDDAKEFMREHLSEDQTLVVHSINTITDALVPLVENELNDFFDRVPGKERGKNSEQQMEL